MRYVFLPLITRHIARCLIACMVWACLHTGLAALQGPDPTAQAAALQEVCTVDGTRWVRLFASGDAVTPGAKPALPLDASGHGLDHCPWCRTTTDAWPDLMRSDLRFAPPDEYQLPPLYRPTSQGHAERTVLATPVRAPPTALG
ncbi:MAG: DUF2946 family protein [Burkholderiaceae bacterium]